MLSDKFLYPSFFRTIPSDKNQVAAVIHLLVRFNWTWIALIGSDNAYGLAGMRSISQQAPYHGICIAYRGVIPSFSDDAVQTMRIMVDSIVKTKVNTIVAFSSKSKLRYFFPYVIEQNVTDKVWIGTEDWSTSSVISGIPGIHTIGTVLGVSIKFASIPGFEEFERKMSEASVQHSHTQEASNGTTSSGNDCLQSTNLYSVARMNFPLEKYDITSSFNVYQAVYAVAHALHRALGCDSGECQRKRVYPWEVSRCELVFLQRNNNSLFSFFVSALTLLLSSPPQLLQWLKQVRFSLGNTSVHFDANGDPPTGYDIISWIWRGTQWSFRKVGSFSPDPIDLTIDADRIQWHNTGDSRPVRPFGVF